MSESVKAALIVAIGLVLGAFLNGGIYEVVGAGAGNAPWSYRLNRFTGEIMSIAISQQMVRILPPREAN
jgi:hypothetical protein